MKYSYTIDEFKKAVVESTSIRQVLIKLGLEPKGGNYRVFKKFAETHQIDFSHFTGQGWNKGKTLPPKRSLDDYLSNKVPISSCSLKKRLLKEKLFEYKCSNCKRTKWLGKNIPLELDHIDGNPSNNNLKNLRLLCPNCHALTPTYRGRNKRKS